MVNTWKIFSFSLFYTFNLHSFLCFLPTRENISTAAAVLFNPLKLHRIIFFHKTYPFNHVLYVSTQLSHSVSVWCRNMCDEILSCGGWCCRSIRLSRQMKIQRQLFPSPRQLDGVVVAVVALSCNISSSRSEIQTMLKVLNCEKNIYQQRSIHVVIFEYIFQ